jgi:hypothetical protein
MKRIATMLAAILASSGALAADKAIATFALTYSLSTSTYTDLIVINESDGNGEYGGYDVKTGRQV